MLKVVPLLFVLVAILLPVRAQTSSTVVPTAAPPWSNRVAHIGGSVTAPILIHSTAPEYTEEARQKKFDGTVQVYLWVDEHGNPSHVMVARGIGMGLDEKAVEAVRHYKFKPARLDGSPVKVDLYIDVNFQMF
jgi:protein TonB